MAGRFVPNSNEINRTLRDPSGLVYPFMNRFGKDVARRARAKALTDRGDLRRSVYSQQPNYGAAGLSLQVGASDHAAMVIHQGHGIIRPKLAPHLKFQPKDLRGSGGFIRTTKVRGVAGHPFITAALKEANNALPGGPVFKINVLKRPRSGRGPTGAPPL